MMIKAFEDKVEMVRRYRASPSRQPAKVAKALGSGYRVTVPLDGASDMFLVQGKELERLLAAFPGVTELWRLFDAA